MTIATVSKMIMKLDADSSASMRDSSACSLFALCFARVRSICSLVMLVPVGYEL